MEKKNTKDIEQERVINPISLSDWNVNLKFISPLDLVFDDSFEQQLAEKWKEWASSAMSEAYRLGRENPYPYSMTNGWYSFQKENISYSKRIEKE